ncbi:MAG TPA: 16S rRNA (uracil(1498)-N(3))-methyltransferase [Bacteroidia bacterium]|jgi:16S rRNA (uracil1498-N3)-methyltransferase|nr:16S rRNA (uracil(1498)-N(3))-methyltransferase [Bacteroidia bacterium]
MNIFIATINHTVAELTAEESWHCTKVLRFKTGDEIGVIDGKGNFYEAQLSTVNEKKCLANITNGPRVQNKHPYYLHLAIAPTKNIDRMEWLVEKAVEIGVDEITFIRCKNSERTVIKEDRLIKITESAVKQSLQAFIPKINPLTNFIDILKINSDLKFIAYCEEETKKHLKTFDLKNKRSLVLIGPEGDFSSEEIILAKQNNFSEISLGENRLRTETAGIYVCNVFALV